MSLKDFAKALAAGFTGPIENALSILVHALLAEFDDVRGTNDISHAQLLEAINRLEDRNNAALSAQAALLSSRILALEDRLQSNDPR